VSIFLYKIKKVDYIVNEVNIYLMQEAIERSWAEEVTLDNADANAGQLVQYFRASAEANLDCVNRIAMFPFVADVLTKEVDRRIEA
jgi:hypothetical protein